VAFSNIGVVWQAKEEFDHALSDYGRAINLDSRPAGAWNNRGIRRLPLGQGEAAQRDFDQRQAGCKDEAWA
jgi:lipoprotein NlpI